LVKWEEQFLSHEYEFMKQNQYENLIWLHVKGVKWIE
jgi:hypothetical protein